MREQRCFVQFIHPGGEHKPDAGTLNGWNKDDHRRKFLKSPGRYLANGVAREGEIVFWGEWEPQSRVVRIYQPPVLGEPRFLYEPYYVPPTDESWRQNTDPFVFGHCFHYTGCLQHTRRGPTQLRYLVPGSLILFGSCKATNFVIDSVFVIANYVDHTKNDWEALLERTISDTYRTVTIEPWYRGEVPEAQSHRLYFGATYEQPVGGMFSFFPCQIFEERGIGFARPQVEMPYVTPTLRQGKKIAYGLSLTEVTDLWKSVVWQIKRQGLMLGVTADLPPIQSQEGGRSECGFTEIRSKPG